MNWLPLSVVRYWGTPYLLIQVLKKTVAQSDALMEGRGATSIHRDVLSIMVSRYETPWDGGRGPTISRCTWLNLELGTGISCTWEDVCLVTLPLWQSRHDLAQELISLAIPGQTNHDVRSLLVVLALG